MKKIIAFTFLIALLSSCEDPIQVKLDKGSPLVVIDAFINDLRKDQVVRITGNDDYFSNRPAPVISNAEVLLEDLTASQTYSFSFINGQYVYPIGPADTIAKVNHRYKLTVKVNGVSYTSETLMKRTAAIDSIQSIYNDGTGGFTTTQPFYICYLFAKDKVDFEPDYYRIKTFRNDTLFNSPSDINISIDGTNGVITPDKAEGLDSLTFTPPGTFLGFKSYKKNDKVRVEIHSINRETANFFIQASQQLQNQGLFATTPENVKTNINTPPGAKVKGVGWFAVSAVAFRERIVN